MRDLVGDVIVSLGTSRTSADTFDLLDALQQPHRGIVKKCFAPPVTCHAHAMLQIRRNLILPQTTQGILERDSLQQLPDRTLTYR